MSVIDGNPGLSTRVIRGPGPADPLFTLVRATRVDLVTPGTVVEATRQDRVEENRTAATYDTAADVLVSAALEMSGAVTLESADTGVATVDGATGRVTRVSDGTARIYARHRLQTLRADVAVRRDAGATVTTFKEYAPGSLARHCADAIDAAIAGKTLATHGPLFSVRDDATATYVWNPDRWTAAWNLTCLSVWNSSLANRKAGTLVSPRHVLFARHYAIPNGSTLRFVKLDGTVVTRTLTAQASPLYPDGVQSDTTVGLLDSDVPAGVGFAKVLPLTSNGKLPSIVVPVGGLIVSANLATSDGVPGIRLNQLKRASTGNLYYRTNVDRTVEGHGVNAQFRMPASDQRLALYEDIVSGDSGHPAFLPVNGELAFVTQWYAGGGGNGGDHGNMAPEINAAMTSLGGGYQLTAVDVSGFTSY